MVSAYTVKKVLPRLLVAAILLNLSIYIVAMAADVANIVGKDVGYLITTPFASAGGNNIKFNTITGIFGTLSTVVLGGAIWGAGMAFIPLFLLFVLLPVLLTVVAILVTVVLRQAIIVLLVIVSPVAFALYCLPNTEKYFKQWWDTLLKTLLVYPIVTVIFAAAEVASFILGQILSKTSDTVTAHLANLMAFVAMMIPLFLVPFSFKIAGGLVGSIYGTLNNLGKKAQTAIKGNPNNPESLQNRTKREAAANLASHNLSSRAIGTRLNPTTVFGRRRRERRLPKLASIRETAQGIYGKQGMAAQAYEQSKDKSEVMGDLALYGSKEESLAAARLEHQTGLQEANQKYATNLQNAHNDLNQRLSNNLITRGQYDSEKMQTDRDLALQHDQDIQSVNDRLQQRLAASSTADIIGRNSYMRRRALMNPATIGYALAGGEEGWNQATSVMKSIAGDDVNMYRSMINEFQFIAKNVGRSDLSGNTDSDVYDLERAWDTQSPAQIAANAKPSSMKAFSNGFVKQMQEAMSILQTRPPSDPKSREALEQKVISSLRFYKELDVVLGSQPTGGIRNEVLKAKQAFKAANVDAILNQTTTDGSNFNRKAQSGVRSVDLRTRGQDTGGSSGSEGGSE